MTVAMVVVMVFGVLVEGRGVDPRHLSSTTTRRNQQLNPHHLSTTKRNQQQPPINTHYNQQHLHAGVYKEDAVVAVEGSVCKVCPPASEMSPCKVSLVPFSPFYNQWLDLG